jgi:hypothetical protein
MTNIWDIENVIIKARSELSGFDVGFSVQVLASVLLSPTPET